jgi:hypothetical protein
VAGSSVVHETVVPETVGPAVSSGAAGAAVVKVASSLTAGPFPGPSVDSTRKWISEEGDRPAIGTSWSRVSPGTEADEPYEDVGPNSTTDVAGSSVDHVTTAVQSRATAAGPR